MFLSCSYSHECNIDASSTQVLPSRLRRQSTPSDDTADNGDSTTTQAQPQTPQKCAVVSVKDIEGQLRSQARFTQYPIDVTCSPHQVNVFQADDKRVRMFWSKTIRKIEFIVHVWNFRTNLQVTKHVERQIRKQKQQKIPSHTDTSQPNTDPITHASSVETPEPNSPDRYASVVLPDLSTPPPPYSSVMASRNANLNGVPKYPPYTADQKTPSSTEKKQSRQTRRSRNHIQLVSHPTNQQTTAAIHFSSPPPPPPPPPPPSTASLIAVGGSTLTYAQVANQQQQQQMQQEISHLQQQPATPSKQQLYTAAVTSTTEHLQQPSSRECSGVAATQQHHQQHTLFYQPHRGVFRNGNFMGVGAQKRQQQNQEKPILRQTLLFSQPPPPLYANKAGASSLSNASFSAESVPQPAPANAAGVFATDHLEERHLEALRMAASHAPSGAGFESNQPAFAPFGNQPVGARFGSQQPMSGLPGVGNSNSIAHPTVRQWFLNAKVASGQPQPEPGGVTPSLASNHIKGGVSAQQPSFGQAPPQPSVYHHLQSHVPHGNILDGYSYPPPPPPSAYQHFQQQRTAPVFQRPWNNNNSNDPMLLQQQIQQRGDLAHSQLTAEDAAFSHQAMQRPNVKIFTSHQRTDVDPASSQHKPRPATSTIPSLMSLEVTYNPDASMFYHCAPGATHVSNFPSGSGVGVPHQSAPLSERFGSSAAQLASFSVRSSTAPRMNDTHAHFQ